MERLGMHQIRSSHLGQLDSGSVGVVSFEGEEVDATRIAVSCQVNSNLSTDTSRRSYH